MATSRDDSRRAAVQATLARQAGESPGAAAIAKATIDVWQRMADRLEPVIGARGVDALFGRALHLTALSFPWMAGARAHGNSSQALENLGACFEGREASSGDAVDACRMLLVTFTDLLANLIGESLTERLLGVVWETGT